jgi:hypothetical protein
MIGMSRGIFINGNQFLRLPAPGNNPAAVSALNNGSSDKLPTRSNDSGYKIIMPVICISPEDKIPTVTPAFCKAPAIHNAKPLASRFASDIIFTDFTLPRTDNRATYCSLFNTRAAACLSSKIILDCCAVLIPSSKANKNIVQTASTATPTTTSQNATRWTDGEYVGPSRTIPAPTAKLASTLMDNSQIWGQKGSTSPDRKLLMYVSVAAILGWMIVTIMAMVQLIKSVMSLWRDHRND